MMHTKRHCSRAGALPEPGDSYPHFGRNASPLAPRSTAGGLNSEPVNHLGRPTPALPGSRMLHQAVPLRRRLSMPTEARVGVPCPDSRALVPMAIAPVLSPTVRFCSAISSALPVPSAHR